jgi:hypothetical protein
MSAWLSRNRLPIGAFVVTLLVLGSVAGGRLRRRSTDPHFGAQAAAWLEGRLDLPRWPAGADDPATIEEVVLDDGRVVRGRRLSTRRAFRIAGEGEVPLERVKETRRKLSYNSFPPFPSVVMLPQVLLHGEHANDVGTTVFVGALVPAALLLLLRRLREAGLSSRGPPEEVWLAALLTFGTVFFFSAVQGRVWFTAHVVGVLLATLYVWATVEARHPILAGLSLGLAFATRTPMLFMAPLFLWEVWRGEPSLRLRRLVLFAVPVAVIGGLLAWYNLARFHELTEFGHSYLAVRQQAQIEQHGLFDLHYLGRNLAVALTLLPEVTATAPFVKISGHGLAVWVTTPALLLLLWPRVRGRWHRPVWLTVACVAGWSLFYQNSGWVQFGYRFILDYMVLLIVLLAIGGRPLGRWSRALIVVGIAVNLFGAITFHRMGAFYRADAATYNCVVPH